MAPAFCAWSTLKPNSQTPRWITAILPVIEPAGYGEQPFGPPAGNATSAGMYDAGPVCVTAGPNCAGPVSRFSRLAGHGAGAVTFTVESITVAYLVTAPTEITLSEDDGRLPVPSAGPLFPCAQTPTTPASTADSAAWVIGSGQLNVFWWLEPQEFESTSAPSRTASSIAWTISTTQPLPFSNPSGLLVG